MAQDKANFPMVWKSENYFLIKKIKFLFKNLTFRFENCIFLRFNDSVSIFSKEFLAISFQCFWCFEIEFFNLLSGLVLLF